MPTKKFRDISILIIIGLGIMGIFFYREWIATSARLGVPLDDVWIHYRFAFNLIKGNGFVYNIGEPVSGSTSPLWVFILAGIFFLSGEFLISSKTVSGCFFLSSAVGSYFLALQQGHRRGIALLVAILTIMAGRLAWASLSGMEVTLFTFLSILAILTHCRDKEKGSKSWSAPLLFGVASLVRPEGYALFACATLDNIIEVSHTNHTKIILKLTAIPFTQIFLYLLIISPYAIFSFCTTGHFLPNTFYAQNELFGLVKRLDYLRIYLVNLWDDHPLLFFFIPLGAGIFFRSAMKNDTVRSPRHSLLILLWTIGYPVLAMFIAPNMRHHQRYMMPLIPLYILLGVSGFTLFLRSAEHYLDQLECISPLGKHTISPRHFSMVSLALVIGVSLYLSVAIWSHRFADDVDNINSQQVAMGEWVKKQIPQESLIALSDIGAITYISGRKKIIDMVGLITPELLTYREASKKDYQDALLLFLYEKKPDYIILHPDCYPRLVEKKAVVHEVHSIELTRYSGISAGKTMVVYKTYWDNFEKRGW